MSNEVNIVIDIILRIGGLCFISVGAYQGAAKRVYPKATYHLLFGAVIYAFGRLPWK